MSTSVRIRNALKALDVVIAHFAQMQRVAEVQPRFDELAAEVNAALEAAATECEQMLSALTRPVWAELPESVQAVCSEALTLRVLPKEETK